MAKLVLVIHNVRSALNVGSMLRTAEGFGVSQVYVTGYTPYHSAEHDERLPHIQRRTTQLINKTALGAESFLDWHHSPDITACLKELTNKDYLLAALEQTPDAVDLNKFKTDRPVALIVGNEVTGLDELVLRLVDQKIQIPMAGRKESFNVAVAAGVALYHLSYMMLPRQK